MNKSKPKQKRTRGVPEEYRKQRQVVIRMTETEYAGLEAMADRQKVPVSFLVRLAIQRMVTDNMNEERK